MVSRSSFRRLAGPALLALAAGVPFAGPAAAQFLGPYGGMWGPPPRVYGPGPVFDDSTLSPRAVAGILRSHGYRLTAAPRLVSDQFVAYGVNGYGERARFVIDAYDGDVLRIAPDRARSAAYGEPGERDLGPAAEPRPKAQRAKPKPKSAARTAPPETKPAPPPVAPQPSESTAVPTPAPQPAAPPQAVIAPEKAPASEPARTPIAPDARPAERSGPADIGPRVQPVPSEARAPAAAEPAPKPAEKPAEPPAAPPADAAPPVEQPKQ